MFCMFSPTDPKLIRTLLATGDRGKLLFGMLNSISDPSKNKKEEEARTISRIPARRRAQPTETTKVQVELFNRSRKDKKVLAVLVISVPAAAPAGFLPEFSTVDLSSRSTLPPPKPGKKGGTAGGAHPSQVHRHRCRHRQPDDLHRARRI